MSVRQDDANFKNQRLAYMLKKEKTHALSFKALQDLVVSMREAEEAKGKTSLFGKNLGSAALDNFHVRLQYFVGRLEADGMFSMVIDSAEDILKTVIHEIDEFSRFFPQTESGYSFANRFFVFKRDEALRLIASWLPSRKTVFHPAIRKAEPGSGSQAEATAAYSAELSKSGLKESPVAIHKLVVHMNVCSIPTTPNAFVTYVGKEGKQKFESLAYVFKDAIVALMGDGQINPSKAMADTDYVIECLVTALEFHSRFFPSNADAHKLAKFLFVDHKKFGHALVHTILH